MDYMEQEQERGTHHRRGDHLFLERDGRNFPEHRINIIDTPGHVDFTIEWSGRCACSTAPSLFLRGCRSSAPVGNGVAANESVQGAAHRLRQQDGSAGANFLRCVEQIKHATTRNPVPIQLPIGAEENFVGVVDLIRMKEIWWTTPRKAPKFEYREIPADMKDFASSGARK